MLSLDQWRNRPLQVRVFTECPRCGQLSDSVKEREMYGPWLARHKVTSCQPCAPGIQATLLEGCVS